MTSALATLFQLVYALFLMAVGAVGMFYTAWELPALYGLDPAAAADPATFLSQYHFLKAVEFGLGLFGVLMRREILAGGVETLIFQGAVLAGIVARGWAWFSHGAPSTMFIAFLVIEVLTFVFIWLHTSRDPDQS
jgi:NADH:ubiquinone oxidoreductase subunit K